MPPITIYNPAINSDPLASGFLTYGQLPLFPLFVQDFPPSQVSDISDVFEVDPLAQTTGSAGITLNTSGTAFTISPGYEPLSYFLSGGVLKRPTGRFLTLAPNEGYAGFTNYDIDLNLSGGSIFDFDPDAARLVPVSEAFPVLDPVVGFSIEFDLAIAYEQSNANRAGFSFTLISNDLTRGAEFGFKEAGLNSDYIFIQNANLNAATAGERSTAPLEISATNRYRVTFQGDAYTLSVNNSMLLTGSLRDYSFNPQASTPPFPSSINPYETPNFLFLGDNTDQGYSDFTLGQIIVTPLPPEPSRFPDFNGDGQVDIVWRNREAALTELWLMEGTTLGESLVINSTVQPGWDLRAVGDFNGNDRPDLLWQNSNTGQAVVWLMNGTALDSGVVLPEVNRSWQVAGTGDFNGDGETDILWRHATSGENAVWFMEGTTRIGGTMLARVPSLLWEVGAVGDFTDDGETDIFWRHRNTGANVVWRMEGTTLVDGVQIASANPIWQARGAADFNGDGNLDILWRQRTGGANALWLMDGLELDSGTLLPALAPGWMPVV